MKHQAIGLVGIALAAQAAGCGDPDKNVYAGVSTDAVVSDLTVEDLTTIYLEIIGTFCDVSADNDPTCACYQAAVEEPSFTATMRTECVGVRVHQVEACDAGMLTGGGATACVADGGGCVFDVGDAFCPAN